MKHMLKATMTSLGLKCSLPPNRLSLITVCGFSPYDSLSLLNHKVHVVTTWNAYYSDDAFTITKNTIVLKRTIIMEKKDCFYFALSY